MTDDLIERLEKASGPDRELDHLLHHKIVEPIGTRLYNTKENGGSFINADVIAPHYTASVDAAIDLAERRFPKHSRTVRREWMTQYRVEYAVRFYPNGWDATADAVRQGVSVDHPVEALAICIAVLKAKEAHDDGQ